MARNYITANQLQQLFEQEKFNPKYHSRTRLKKMIADVGQGRDKVWLWDTTTNLNEPPKRNNGLTVCDTCRQLYWITPTKDSYRVRKPEGSVIIQCYPCFISTD